MTGVWEYVAPSWPGRAILARQGSKCTGVWFAQDPNAPKAAATTEAERAAAYAAFGGGAWDYTCERLDAGTLRCTLRTLFAKVPSEVGSEATLEMTLDGDNAKWSFIDQDGKRVNPGASRRLR
jgi:hypothetical protein